MRRSIKLPATTFDSAAMQPNFLSLEYLRNGNKRQQRVYDVLVSYDIIKQLLPYDPVLTGTIPLDIDIESSDADIICCFEDSTTFSDHVAMLFRHHADFNIHQAVVQGRTTIIGKFKVAEFAVEIFGQNRPAVQQESYIHMVNEYHILQSLGPEFRNEIIRLKRAGLKTEPAFAQALQLSGDPYEALLKYSK